MLYGYTRTHILTACPHSFYNFHTRRARITHANAHTLNAYTPNTHIARPFETYIVRMDRFTTPVATFACGFASNPRKHKISTITCGQKGEGGEMKRTRRKTAKEFRLIASSKGGAGIGLGPGIVSGVEAESGTLSSLLPRRRTTLRSDTGEYVLLENGVGEKARAGSK